MAEIVAPAVHVTSAPQNSRPVLTVLGIAGAIILAAAIMPRIATAYGDTELALAVDHDNRQVCNGFGFSTESPAFTDCMKALSALRQRHEELVAAYTFR